MDDENLLHESLSGHSSVCGDSDLNDLQYDQSLIENLFYKTPVSGLSSSFRLCLLLSSVHSCGYGNENKVFGFFSGV